MCTQYTFIHTLFTFLQVLQCFLTEFVLFLHIPIFMFLSYIPTHSVYIPSGSAMFVKQCPLFLYIIIRSGKPFRVFHAFLLHSYTFRLRSFRFCNVVFQEFFLFSYLHTHSLQPFHSFWRLTSKTCWKNDSLVKFAVGSFCHAPICVDIDMRAGVVVSCGGKL